MHRYKAARPPAEQAHVCLTRESSSWSFCLAAMFDLRADDDEAQNEPEGADC